MCFDTTLTFISLNWSFIVLLLGLLFINAITVSCFFALVKIRYSSLSQEALSQIRKKRFLAFIIDKSEVLGNILQFMSMACLFGSGLFIYPFVLNILNIRDASIVPLGLMMGLGFLIFLFQYIITYYVPQILGMLFPKNTLHSNSWFIVVLMVLIWPFLMLVRKLSSSILKKLHIKSQEAFNILDLQVQVRALGQETLVVPKFTQEILENALRMKDLQAADILLPRDQVHYLDLRRPLADNIQKAKTEGYTRYPLCETDLDSTIGIIHMQDLFAHGNLQEVNLRLIKRPIIRVAMTTPIQKILRRLLHKRMHMALVVDEFQRTVGIITLEHILEELVGDIQDEFDKEEDFIQRLSAQTFKIAGLTPIHEVEEVLGISLPHQNVSTFGGLITSELGRIPEKNEKLSIQDLNIHIEEVSKKRIVSTTVTLLKKEEE